MEPFEGKMNETSSSASVSTKQERIAKLAKEAPDMAFTTLAHHVDLAWLREAYERTRKDGATGVDGVTAAEYATKLEENLQSLLDRAKSGTYRAPPVRRVHIPKGDGKQTRPIGIPTFEDKVLQRAIVMLLEPLYEQDFKDFSYGFRPGRSAHQALQALHTGIMQMRGGWVLEVDIAKFFDTVDHERLREILSRRVRDGVVLRLIGKWLNAGVLEGLVLSHPEDGTPQGGVVSPMLANLFLHDVVDEWFVRDVQPQLSSCSLLVRYADDMVFAFEHEEDARRVLDVLEKRFEKYGLKLHPEKTRLVKFTRPPRSPQYDDQDGSGTFDFLGFTHHWGRSLAGNNVVKQKTAKDRLSRSLHRVTDWCRRYRHQTLKSQQQTLGRKLRGHYAYYGITGNFPALRALYGEVKRIWRKWLSRRSNDGYVSWAKMDALLKRHPLPLPRIVHQYRYAT
jgi:group II intron reverse transcriptase/maturase